MDEDIFDDYCTMKSTKEDSISFKKLIRTSSNSNTMKNIASPVERIIEPEIKCEPLSSKIAVEYLLSGKLKSAVCRYCLNISPALCELDQIMQIAGTGSLYKVSIREMIACFYPYKTGQDPNFPEKICQKCLDRAINAYLFTQQCERAGRALVNCFDDIYEKLDKLDPIVRQKKRGRQKLNPNYNTLYAEHKKVIDYAEPIINIINVGAEMLSQEPEWNEFECKKCWQVLPTLESLLNHEKIHPKFMWYSCRLCGKSFPKLIQLKKHNTQVHVHGKGNHIEAVKNFKCNKCGNESDNYTQHLQHIEKHKFKSIMQHLIEKKTDKLCLVCLNKSTDLVELDKMICIHGGHPELMGDKTLYTVLASTLPDQKTYKYQELHVPYTANIMTICKRKNNRDDIESKDVNCIHFVLSSPAVVSQDKFKTNDFYCYIFCEPNTVTDVNDSTTDNTAKITEIFDEETSDIIGNCNAEKTVIDDGKIMDKVRDCMPKDGHDSMDLLKHCSSVGEMLINDKNSIVLINNRNENGDILNGEAMDLIENDTENKILRDDSSHNYNPKKNIIENKDSETEILKPTFKNQTHIFCFSNPELEGDEYRNKEYRTQCKKPRLDTAYKFSYPNYNIISKDEEIVNTLQEIKYDTELNNESVERWIFSQSSKESNYNSSKVAESDMISKEIEKNNCKLCWVFKHSNKCEYCKKTNAEPPKVGNQNIIDIVTLPGNAASAIEKVTQTSVQKNVEEHRDGHNMDKIWQCNVCLTNNNPDRSACSCCESKKHIDNGKFKIAFGSNKSFLINIKRDDVTLNTVKDCIQKKESKPVIIEEPSMMDFKSAINTENEIVFTNDTTQGMDIEIDNLNHIIDTKSNHGFEYMDVEENLPIPTLPNLTQNFNTTFNTIPINTLPFVHQNLQFNIGTTKMEPGKGPRKFKRAFRTMPKAFHK